MFRSAGNLPDLILQEVLSLIDLGRILAVGFRIDEVASLIDGAFDLILVAGNGSLDLVDEVHSASFPSHSRFEPGSVDIVTPARPLSQGVGRDQWVGTPEARGWRDGPDGPLRHNDEVLTPPLIVLNGPTASGKTALAVRVAQLLREQGRPAEIVNADSMLVYRGMDIGTAKPTPAERGGVTHHLIDLLEVDQTASVATFQRLARAAIADCRSRGVVPILVGGSALYVHAILDEFEFPGTDPALRARLEDELARLGPAALHGRLAERSPEAAADILPGNGRRIVRALEVIELTGSWRATLPAWSYAVDGVQQWGLEMPREVLDERIDARVERMWADGLVAEVRTLLGRGLREGRTASRALGYRQVLAFLDGELSEQEAKRQTVAGTRRFARKQLGWFRRDPRIHWLPAAEPGLAEYLLTQVSPDA